MRIFWKSLLAFGISIFLLSSAGNTWAHSLSENTGAETSSAQEVEANASQFGPPSLLSGSRVQVVTEKPGSVFAVGSVVEVSAPIHGDLIVIAGSVQVLAPVFGDIYILAGDTVVSSIVHGGVVSLSANFFQETTSEVEGYGLLMAKKATLQGSFHQRVELWSQRLQIAESARFMNGIFGTLAGDASRHELGKENIQNFSFFEQKTPQKKDGVEQVSMFGRKLFTKWLQLFIVTLFFLWVIPTLAVKKYGLMVTQSRWLSFYGSGVVVLVTLPIVCIILLPIPALWPLLFFGLALWSIALLGSAVPFVATLEQILRQQVEFFASVPHWIRIGTAAFFLALLATTPIAGLFISLLLAPLGVGHLLSLWKQR